MKNVPYFRIFKTEQIGNRGNAMIVFILQKILFVKAFSYLQEHKFGKYSFKEHLVTSDGVS